MTVMPPAAAPVRAGGIDHIAVDRLEVEHRARAGVCVEAALEGQGTSVIPSPARPSTTAVIQVPVMPGTFSAISLIVVVGSRPPCVNDAAGRGQG